MFGLFARACAVWVIIAVAEVLHGIVRVRLLNRRVGDKRARQIAVFTGSLLILAIAWTAAPWLDVRSTAQACAVGAAWVGLMLGFEVGFGRLVMRASWERIAADFDVRRGGLLGFGMAVLFFAPFLAARWRGLI